ncbi:hypothetical protein [Pseudomonas sp. LW8]|uniref:hypothetical protein n=1 Tax=Pseudomonas sp. LW8 TaxID=3242677 RepID=UPI0035BEC824
MKMLNVRPPSRASPLPQGFVAQPNQWSTRNIVGASLLAKALGQSAKMLDVPPPSRASPLPQGFVAQSNQWSTRNIVGASLLANALGQSEDVECAAVFASRLAPTGDLAHGYSNPGRLKLVFTMSVTELHQGARESLSL